MAGERGKVVAEWRGKAAQCRSGHMLGTQLSARPAAPLDNPARWLRLLGQYVQDLGVGVTLTAGG
jgi:hypothetical protein